MAKKAKVEKPKKEKRQKADDFIKSMPKSENQEIKKVGRPSKYDPKFCEMLIEHMASGLSFESFAGVLTIDRDTLYEWVNVHKEFSDSKKIGLDKCLIFWENLGVKNIMNESESFGQGQSIAKSLNSAVYIFNMKNRFKWRDKQPDETDVIVNNINSLSDSDLDAKIEEKMKKLKQTKG